MWQMVDISAVLVPALEEGNNRVYKEEKDKQEGKDLLDTDLEDGGGYDHGRVRLFIV